MLLFVCGSIENSSVDDMQDTTRIYWPSSPSNGVIVDDIDRGLYIQRWGNGGSPDYGDIHRYVHGETS